MIHSRNIYQKIWESHLVEKINGADVLLYIDLHLLHEINTPQAFDGLRSKKLIVRRPDRTFSTEDHNVSTFSSADLDDDTETWNQIKLLRENTKNNKIEHVRLGSQYHGITHVIAPEQGRVTPGMTVVCCDSHTTTHGALGALAFGIGTTQVEHVLATQTLLTVPFKTMSISIEGTLSTDVDAKDLALHIIRKIGTGGGQGYIIEYRGNVVKDMSVEQRMTLCNMTVEAGASAGIVSPDDKTIAYLKDALTKRNVNVTIEDCIKWLSFATDEDAKFDREVIIDACLVKKMVTWGTNPSQAIAIDEVVPKIESIDNIHERMAAESAYEYMGLSGGEHLSSLKITNVFVGSCTNGRIEDFRSIARILKGRKVHPEVHMLLVPGSMAVHYKILEEGLDRIFLESGADYRTLAGCSLCVGLNTDKLSIGKRTVSTSNRNFEGRQGAGVRTHIASPSVAAASAINGYISSSLHL